MATKRQREADAPRPAANADPAAPAPAAVDFSGLFEAVEALKEVATLNRVMKEGFRDLIKNVQRLYEASNKSLSVLDKKEAQVQKVMEELEREKAQKQALVQMVMEVLESEKARKEAQAQKVMKLESGKAQKEAQVQKVMEENVTLHAMLDKKETQLQAMSEQCKFMALNHHN